VLINLVFTSIALFTIIYILKIIIVLIVGVAIIRIISLEDYKEFMKQIISLWIQIIRMWFLLNLCQAYHILIHNIICIIADWLVVGIKRIVFLLKWDVLILVLCSTWLKVRKLMLFGSMSWIIITPLLFLTMISTLVSIVLELWEKILIAVYKIMDGK